MGIYYLDEVGLVNIATNTVKCKFKITPAEFFTHFSVLEPILSSSAKKAIERSIISGVEEKIKNQDEIEDFFIKVKAQIKDESRVVS